MIKAYEALVLEVDEPDGERVLLQIEGVVVKCFVNYCPRIIEVGHQYAVELSLLLPDEDYVNQISERRRAVVGRGYYACVVCGYLDGSTLRSFVDFTGLDFNYIYPCLNNEYVEVGVDRIDVSFV